MNDKNTTHFLAHSDGHLEPVAYTDSRICIWDRNMVVKKKHGVENKYNPLSVLSIKSYPRDLKIADAFQVGRRTDDEKEKKKRGAIKKYSFGANKRCKLFMRNTAHLMKVMITLTYPKNYPMDGALVKKQFHKFLGWLRYRKYKNIWVLEFQGRGAPHIHVLVDREIPYQDVADYWYKVVDSGDEKHLKAGTKVEAIRAKDSIGHYLTSYMDKSKQKTVPPEYMKVGRFWGSSRGLLAEKKIRIYGKREVINGLRKDLRVVKKYSDAQKRSWDKKAREKGKKNKFKKHYNKSSIHVVNSDKMVAELDKHGLRPFIYDLVDVEPVPPPPVDGRGGRLAPLPSTQKLKWKETYDEWLDRMGFT